MPLLGDSFYEGAVTSEGLKIKLGNKLVKCGDYFLIYVSYYKNELGKIPLIVKWLFLLSVKVALLRNWVFFLILYMYI